MDDRFTTGELLLSLIELMYALALPAVLFILHRRRTDAKAFPLIVGFLTYLVVSWVRGVFRLFIPAEGLIVQAFFNALLSASMEETGRHFSMKRILNGYIEPHNAVSYGIGHGGCELIMSTGLSVLNALITSVQTGQGDNSLFLVILGMITMLTGILTHICLSLIVFKGVGTDSRKYLFIAMAIHFATNFIGAIVIHYSALLYIPLDVIFLIICIRWLRRVYNP